LTATVFEAGYVADDPEVHAVKRTLRGARTLCGKDPARVLGRFDPGVDAVCGTCSSLSETGV
jgi:hypothetical protein